MGDASININYFYCGVEPSANAALIIVGVAEVGKAAHMLERVLPLLVGVKPINERDPETRLTESGPFFVMGSVLQEQDYRTEALLAPVHAKPCVVPETKPAAAGILDKTLLNRRRAASGEAHRSCNLCCRWHTVSEHHAAGVLCACPARDKRGSNDDPAARGTLVRVGFATNHARPRHVAF